MKNNNFDLTKFSEKRLLIYIAIISCCALLTIFNLIIKEVGLTALFAGNQDERNLILLSLFILIICISLIVYLLLTIQKKRNLKKIEEELKLKKKAKKMERKNKKESRG